MHVACPPRCPQFLQLKEAWNIANGTFNGDGSSSDSSDSEDDKSPLHTQRPATLEDV